MGPSVEALRRVRLQLRMSGGVAGWLVDRSEDIYTAQVLRLSKESAVAALSKGERLVEIEFPASRGNDPSVTETLDKTRDFARELLKDSYFTKLGTSLWVLFPDAKEAFLARQKWGDKLPFVLTSIQGALTEKALSAETQPVCLVCVSPGFNIPEWIDIEKVATSQPQSQILTINGNLERLRNGYYPALFYPGLTAVTNRFYKKFKSVFVINPIAVGGDRLGAWLYKVGLSEPWQVLVKTNSQASGAESGGRTSLPRLDSISSSEQEPKASDAWRLATAAYNERNRRFFS